ncbi:MAG TPA: hypothetical protein VG325_00050 [Solirubrobacteraceae bacterium]|nr:hypothetical protein [Solirubrobacteraceae bacterium]
MMIWPHWNPAVLLTGLLGRPPVGTPETGMTLVPVDGMLTGPVTGVTIVPGGGATVVSVTGVVVGALAPVGGAAPVAVAGTAPAVGAVGEGVGAVEEGSPGCGRLILAGPGIGYPAFARHASTDAGNGTDAIGTPDAGAGVGTGTTSAVAMAGPPASTPPITTPATHRISRDISTSPC